MNASQHRSPLHAYLAGQGSDGRGRTIEDVLALPDEALERIHDYIQWLFPLPTRSMAQPGAPVLTPDEIASIRADEQAIANLRRAAERMRRFYERTDDWLSPHDHNHLRITRILQSLRLLAGESDARVFHQAVMIRQQASGSPVNRQSLAYWERAVGG
ncbi:opioid growth factor receptor-related protein [Microvirga subterranea]|uniref:Opioid growth factor receptor-like protein n=1 Tax=Microvirga subterranea TaxID=186651 RepID=A0A370HK33_9HYPH|nr:opioid growth factor receptor-related protein [Microvirga subterranea]RDI58888.1 opioid growth factor receptor-like protein [Microvirga subterranea]